MQGFMKVALIIVALFVSVVIIGLMKESRGGSGYSVFIVLILWAVIKAIWNYSSDKPEEKQTVDIEKLDKN